MDHSIGNRDKGRSKPPSLLACIACRRSHLKCDGQKPLCRRCAEKGCECQWIESRRGYRDYRRQATPPREKPSKEHKSQQKQQGSLGQDDVLAFPVGQEVPSDVDAFALGGNFGDLQPYTYEQLFGAPYPSTGDLYSDGSLAFTNFQMLVDPVVDPASSPSGSTGSSTTSSRRVIPSSRQDGGTKEAVDLIEAFYKYYYVAHPFIVPQNLAHQRPDLLPKHLRATMRFLAAHYTPTHNINALHKAAQKILSDEVPDDVFKIQGLIIYAGTCLGRYEQAPGVQALEKAIRLGLKLGINKHSFALAQAPSNPILQECFRRTWWALFMVDGLVTAIGGQSTFRLQSVFSDIPLPCDDKQYNNLYLTSPPRSLSQFRHRTFSEDPYPYSSHAYAIEALYIMGSTFNITSNNTQSTCTVDPQVEALDASISNFLFSLPPNKREVLPNPHTNLLDEPLLAAHMIINWASIQLHRPRSTLTFIRNHENSHQTQQDDYASVPSCAQGNTPPPAAPTTSNSYASHTSKALLAANNIIQLGSLPRPIAHCTPVMMCAITAAATVHLPAYALATAAEEDNLGITDAVGSGTSGAAALAIRERLQLGISALGRFAEIWPRAKIAKGQVAGFAREVLNSSSMMKQRGGNNDSSDSNETVVQQQQGGDNTTNTRPDGMRGFSGDFLAPRVVAGEGMGTTEYTRRSSPGLDFDAAGLSMTGSSSSGDGSGGGDMDGAFLDADSFIDEANTADWMALMAGRDMDGSLLGNQRQGQWGMNDVMT